MNNVFILSLYIGLFYLCEIYKVFILVCINMTEFFPFN